MCQGQGQMKMTYFTNPYFFMFTEYQGQIKGGRFPVYYKCVCDLWVTWMACL